MSIRAIRFLAASVVLLTSNTGQAIAAQNEIEFHESRPLGKLTIQLSDRYGVPFTYEEAPYDDTTELFAKTYPTGTRFRSPAWKPITFYIGPLVPAGGSNAVNQASAGAGAIAESVVTEYNSSGNPGRFRVIRDGDYVHIVPSGRLRNGKFEEFQPVLDTKVTFVYTHPRMCLDVMNDLVAQVGNLRGVNIAHDLPSGPLIQNQCQIEGTDLTARDALKQLLHQIELPQQSPSSRFRYSWALCYDVNEDTYFLSVQMVHARSSPAPDRNPKPVSAPDAASSSPINGQMIGSRPSASK